MDEFSSLIADESVKSFITIAPDMSKIVQDLTDSVDLLTKESEVTSGSININPKSNNSESANLSLIELKKDIDALKTRFSAEVDGQMAQMRREVDELKHAVKEMSESSKQIQMENNELQEDLKLFTPEVIREMGTYSENIRDLRLSLGEISNRKAEKSTILSLATTEYCKEMFASLTSKTREGFETVERTVAEQWEDLHDILATKADRDLLDEVHQNLLLLLDNEPGPGVAFGAKSLCVTSEREREQVSCLSCHRKLKDRQGYLLPGINPEDVINSSSRFASKTPINPAGKFHSLATSPMLQDPELRDRYLAMTSMMKETTQAAIISKEKDVKGSDGRTYKGRLYDMKELHAAKAQRRTTSPNPEFSPRMREVLPTSTPRQYKPSQGGRRLTTAPSASASTLPFPHRTERYPSSIPSNPSRGK